MRIIHYSLGLPPYRSGGLTKYCCDLMLSQVSRGHEVSLVWPGRMGGRLAFREEIVWNGVRSFEMTNPMPVPYDEGIIDPAPYLEGRDSNVCLDFLRNLAPDVLHVHSFMGLPAEFVESARALGTKTVFTTHDYYPLCPRVTMFHDGAVCRPDLSCGDCPVCNAGGLSLGKIRVLQSPVYRSVKSAAPVRALRAHHRAKVGSNVPTVTRSTAATVSATAYQALLYHNLAMLRCFDIIHANSTLAADIYQSYLPNAKIRVVPIGNAETQGTFLSNEGVVGNPPRLGYFGAEISSKGYYLLLDVLRGLWNDGLRFELHLYGPFDCQDPFACVHPRYDYSEIDAVYEATDLALVPSLWPETFGFQATEALCRGVPVVVSSMVGMKDVLGEGMGVVFEPTHEALAAALRDCLVPGRIEAMRAVVRESFTPPRLERVETLYACEGGA